jgi:hypothetical protein
MSAVKSISRIVIVAIVVVGVVVRVRRMMMMRVNLLHSQSLKMANT